MGILQNHCSLDATEILVSAMVRSDYWERFWRIHFSMLLVLEFGQGVLGAVSVGISCCHSMDMSKISSAFANSSAAFSSCHSGRDERKKEICLN